MLPQLPGSIHSLWGAAASSSAVPIGLAIAGQQEKEMEIPLTGAVRIDLDVRRDGPIGPSDEDKTKTLDQSSPTGLAPGESSDSPPEQGVPSKEDSV